MPTPRPSLTHHDAPDAVASRHFDLAVAEALARPRDGVAGGGSQIDVAERVLARLRRPTPARRRRWGLAIAVAAAAVVVAVSWLSSGADGRSGARAAAAAAEPQDPVPAPASITLAGRCVDETGQSLAKVKVHLFHKQAAEGSSPLVRSTLSAADGSFALQVAAVDGGPKGFDSLFVLGETQGRACAVFGLDAMRDGGFGRDGKLAGRGDIALVMGPARAISGRVVDQQGAPVGHATVHVAAIGAADDPSQPMFTFWEPNPMLQTHTDEEGRFRLEHLAEGEMLTVYASSARHAAQYARVAAPDDVVIVLLPAGQVRGRVVFPDGTPAPNVRVEAQGVAHSGWASVRTDRDGRYLLPSLREDTYNIWAQAEGYTVRAHAGFQVQVGEVVEAPDLELIAGGFIAGVVRDAKGAPLPAGSGLVMVYGPSRPQPGAATDTAPLLDGGAFRIRVAPGANRIYFCDALGTLRSAAAEVTVEEGEEVRIELVVSKFAAGRQPR